MVIELQGLGVIIMVGSLCLSGLIHFIRIIIDSGLIWEIKDLITKIKKIPVIKTKKLRFEIGMITVWIRNKNGIRSAIKNFYAWGRIGKITQNHKTYERLRYLAAFSMGKPLESQLKENNKSREKYNKIIVDIEDF